MPLTPVTECTSKSSGRVRSATTWYSFSRSLRWMRSAFFGKRLMAGEQNKPEVLGGHRRFDGGVAPIEQHHQLELGGGAVFDQLGQLRQLDEQKTLRQREVLVQAAGSLGTSANRS